MAKEYIEKEAFIAHEKRQMHEVHDLGILCGAQGCLNDLKKFPAANVREVVRGEWIYTSDCSGAGYPVEKCSICGAEWEEAGWKFCPNCGAKMEVQER